MTTNYARGRAAEYRAKKMLERQGWLVIRSAGSRSPVDLIALQPLKRDYRAWAALADVLLVQVKRNAHLTRAERTNLKMLKRYGNVQCWRFVGPGKPLVEVL